MTEIRSRKVESQRRSSDTKIRVLGIEEASDGKLDGRDGEARVGEDSGRVERGGEEVSGEVEGHEAEGVGAGGGVEVGDVREEATDSGGLGGFGGEVAADARVDEGAAEEVDGGEEEGGGEGGAGGKDEGAESGEVWQRRFFGAVGCALRQEVLHGADGGGGAGGAHLGDELVEGGEFGVGDGVERGVLDAGEVEVRVWVRRVGHLEE